MKKIILSLVIVSALFILKANAQFSVGPKFGLNLAMVTDSTSTGYKGVLNKGVHYGVVFNYQMKEAFSLQTELLYTVKGEKQISGEIRIIVGPD